MTPVQTDESGPGRLEGQQVRLRPLRREDSSLLYEWITDRNLVLFNAAYRPVSEVEHEEWVEAMLRGDPERVLFVIEELLTARAIGTCQLFRINGVHRNAELQIRLGDSLSQGRGLGSEAVALLVRFGFHDLNLHRIYLHVFATNERAIRAYEKNGFATEGRLRSAAHIDGSFVDVICMGLVRTA